MDKLADKLREVREFLVKRACLCLRCFSDDRLVGGYCDRCKALTDFPDPDAVGVVMKHVIELPSRKQMPLDLQAALVKLEGP